MPTSALLCARRQHEALFTLLKPEQTAGYELFQRTSLENAVAGQSLLAELHRLTDAATAQAAARASAAVSARAADVDSAIFAAESRVGAKSAGDTAEEPGSKRVKTDGQSGSLCCICQSAPCELVLQPCKHLCICQVCLPRMPRRLCPMCRKDFTDTLRVYLS
jgi:hypothetical protein